MKTRTHFADTVFSFFLLLIFGMFTLFFSGMGASVYRSSAAHLEENYTSRTAVAYVSEKIRQHDSSGSISLTELEGIPSLCLSEQISGEEFFTYIYYYDGALRELFIRSSTVPQAKSGSSIVELASFSIEEHSSSPDLYEITACSKNGLPLSSLVHVSGIRNLYEK